MSVLQETEATALISSLAVWNSRMKSSSKGSKILILIARAIAHAHPFFIVGAVDIVALVRRQSLHICPRLRKERTTHRNASFAPSFSQRPLKWHLWSLLISTSRLLLCIQLPHIRHWALNHALPICTTACGSFALLDGVNFTYIEVQLVDYER